jgi:hypothetical protein
MRAGMQPRSVRAQWGPGATSLAPVHAQAVIAVDALHSLTRTALQEEDVVQLNAGMA